MKCGGRSVDIVRSRTQAMEFNTYEVNFQLGLTAVIPLKFFLASQFALYIIPQYFMS
jgi:hypothetical protein